MNRSGSEELDALISVTTETARHSEPSDWCNKMGSIYEVFLPKTSNLNLRKAPDPNTKFTRNRRIEARVTTTTDMLLAKPRAWGDATGQMTQFLQ